MTPAPLVLSDDQRRVRVLTLNRPEVLNAFNQELYDAATDALLAAAGDPDVAVVILTGAGRAFSAGQDLLEMADRTGSGRTAATGERGFPDFIDALTTFPKPLLCAVNGVGVGIGATLLGFADLVFMSGEARLRCPFTSLGVAPEAASSFTFPLAAGRQQASWALLSSQWLSAEECRQMGLVWKVCPPEQLAAVAMAHAGILAQQPISSLIETKRAIVAPLLDGIAAARGREDAAFARLLRGSASREALQAFAEHRPADFTNLPPGT